jgi:hypothetical protein
MKLLAPAAAALALSNAAIASPLVAHATASGKTVSNRQIVSGSLYAYPSEVWSGAGIVSSNITQVIGTFTVPTPSIPPGGNSSTEYCGSVWAGIDGNGCVSGLIQSGVACCAQDGEPSYQAWYEWIPQQAVYFDTFDVSSRRLDHRHRHDD